MKKLLALMLAAALAFSLVACGGGGGAGDNNTSSTGNGDTTSTDTPSGGGEDSAPSMTKEEMLEQAIECTAGEIAVETGNNIAKAKQTYCEKTLSIYGWIFEISTDHITISGGDTNFEVYLPAEDIVNLESRQYVTIVGNTGAEIREEATAPGIPQNVYIYEVSPAYLVTDRYERSGIPISKNDSFPGAWNVKFPDSNNPEKLRLVYFNDSVDVSQYEGKEITFSAKIFPDSNWNNVYHDAVIVE